MLTKICGITDKVSLQAAVEGNASFVGLVFYPPSPRYLTVSAAQDLLKYEALQDTKIVALTVNADPLMLQTIVDTVKPDILQLHGDESPIMCSEARQHYKLPVIKAISVRRKEDLELAESYYGSVDYLLLDAPTNPDNPDAAYGGSGKTFDWRLLKAWDCPVPWLLAGGLDKTNVCQAIRQTNPYGVDVSSGVELERGTKCVDKINGFLEEVKTCVKP